MENTLPQANAIRQMGSVATPLRPDLRLPMIAARDIGAAASEALLRPSTQGKKVRELLGQRDLTYPEVAATIGRAIGKPDLKYVQAPDDMFRSVPRENGNVRTSRRHAAGNDRYPECRKNARPRTSLTPEHHTHNLRNLRSRHIRPRISTPSRSLTARGRGGRLVRPDRRKAAPPGPFVFPPSLYPDIFFPVFR